MSRVLVLLSLAFGLTSLCAVDQNTSPVSSCIKSWTFESKDMTLDKIDLTLLQKDLDSLKSIYTCIHDASKKLMSVDVKDSYEKHKNIISDSVELNKYSVVFRNKVKKIKDEVDKELKKNGTSTLANISSIMRRTFSTGTKNYPDQSKKLEPILTEAEAMVTNTSALASGVFAIYEAKRDLSRADLSIPEMCVTDIIDPINTKLKDNSSLNETESLISQVSKLKDDDKSIDDEKLKTKFVGPYTDVAKKDEFLNNLMENKYAISSGTIQKTSTTTGLNVSAATTSTTTSTTISPEQAAKLTAEQTKAAEEKAKKDKEWEDLKKAVEVMQLKESIPPSTTADSKNSGTTGSSGIGSVEAQSPQGYDAVKESERRKWLERAKQLDEQALRQAMKQTLKSGRVSSRAPFAKSYGSSGSFSLRDLFSKPSSSDDPYDDKKINKEKGTSFFGDNAAKTQDADKYKKYYDMGTGPTDASLKDLSRSNFDSMYESARIKALTEGADTEYAGRYIDPFLLVHSIIYDYYSKGLLLDNSEAREPFSMGK